MELFILHIGTLVFLATASSYVVIRMIKHLSELALFISLAAALIFLIGLAYSQEEIVRKHASALSSTKYRQEFDKFCSTQEESNTHCYEHTVYRGFPSKDIAYNIGSEGNWENFEVLGWRGSGVFGSIIINSFILSIIILPIKLALLRSKQTR